MRPLARDFRALLLVSSVPVLLAAVFPYGAVGFRAGAERAPEGCSLAMVELTEEAVRGALKAARSSWQTDSSGGSRGLRADLSSGELPGEPWLPVLGIERRSELPGLPCVEPDFPAFRPSAAAPAPARLEPADTAPAAAFPREELLRPADFRKQNP